MAKKNVRFKAIIKKKNREKKKGQNETFRQNNPKTNWETGAQNFLIILFF